MTWLLKGGITQSLREAYSLTWTKKYGRAILPVYTTATALETIVLRKLYKEDAGPKYLMQSSSPERSVFLSKEIRAKPGNYLFDVVIVEDALSTMRVGEYVPTGSLLGTSLGQGKLSRILSHSGQSEPRVGVWLDPDKAGAVGAAKVSHMLTLMGISNQIIRSPKDPKNLSNIEIVRRLMGDRPHPIEDYEDPARFRAS
jgi:hypothetical protein